MIFNPFHKRPIKYLVIGVLVSSVLILLNITLPIDPDTLRQKYTNDASKFITIAENQVHYRDEGKGEPVLLLHGTASSLHAWDEWTRHLTKKYRVIRMDLPGFGLTGPDKEDRYEVADDIRFIDELADTLQLDSFHLAGSSLGGRIAWEYSVAHPNKVKSLTLLNAVGYPQETWPLPILLGQVPVIDQVVSHFQPRFMVRTALKDIYHDDTIITDELVTRYHELARYPGNLNAFIKRVKARLDKDHTKISRVTTPTLIMWGEEDNYFPLASGRQFAKDIVGSRLITYPEIGHLPMEEDPKKTVEDFIRFMTKLTPKQ